MTRLTRRSALRVAGGATAAALAGCLGGGSSGDGDGDGDGDDAAETLTLGELAVTNFDTNPHTVHVVFFDDEDPVYWRSREIAAAEDGPEDFVLEGYPSEPGEQVLHVRLDDQPAAKWVRFDFGESDASCLGLHVRIGDFSEDRGDELSIWKGDNPR